MSPLGCTLRVRTTRGLGGGGAAAEQAEQTRCSEERRKKLKLKLWKKCAGAASQAAPIFRTLVLLKSNDRSAAAGRVTPEEFSKTHYKADEKKNRK